MKCEVCGSTDFHAPNSYICKLVNSPCKHKWGDKVETDEKCQNCKKGFTVYQCTKCPMVSALHWSETFFHDNSACLADPECDSCHGSGTVSIGNECTGFGGELGKSHECMCIVYNKIGMDSKTGERKKK